MYTIKDLTNLVRRPAKVYFIYYQTNELWYHTETLPGQDEPLAFPVPIEDCGSGVFLPEDRAMMFMRYIRKHLKWLDESRTDQNE